MRAGEIGCKRLLHEHRFAPCERAACDLRLKVRRDRDGNSCNGAVLDQHAPVAEPTRNVQSLRQPGSALRIRARQRDHFATRIRAECGEEDVAPVIAADDTHSNHAAVLSHLTTDEVWSLRPATGP